jgi:cell division protein FtsW (lipid II flippase)
MWQLLLSGAVFFLIAKEFPGFANWFMCAFLLSFALLLVNPAAGAALVMFFVFTGIIFAALLLLPYILAYFAGILFFILLIIGLGELVNGR